MKKHYLISALALALGISGAQAVERPKTPAGAPEDGGKYILVNAYNPTGYMSRTSWDGALYFLGKDDSNYANHAFTAQKNDDETWSFYTSVFVEVDSLTSDSIYEPNYLVMNSGSGNVNMNTTELTKWTVSPGVVDGFYTLTAGEGNFGDFLGLKLHLNGGAQFFVISEINNGGGWYPDYAGGATPADNDWGWVVDDNGRAIMNDSTSENWAFIKVEDVPAHMAVYQVYQVIADYENYYEGLEGPHDGGSVGFKATDDAVSAIYSAAEFDAEADYQTIVDMINAKKALYDAIVLASAAEEPTAALTTAIETACTAFDTMTATADVEAAKAALTEALNAFNQGAGDYTSFGANMSFEDLSAQGGYTTTGVAAPPAGWTVIIDGDTVRTIEDVNAHGIGNWHGVNADCAGDVKDGNYGFGLWAPAVPEYQISQTITGLDNGTYVISAGLMVGANGASRRTTQRIFGNLNSKYFGSEYEYDLSLLDGGEVYGFQGNVEPVTDTEMQPMEVRAYVYDGTLTFGLRTNGNYAAALNESNSGTGWFKIDNFRLYKEGYVGADAAAVANHFIELIADYTGEKMQDAIIDKLDQALDGISEVDENEDPAKINNIIVTLKALVPEAAASVDAYTRFEAAINEAYEKSAGYEFYAGFDEYITLVDEAYSAHDDAYVSVAEIDSIIALFGPAFVELQKSGIAVGDYMGIIQNPSFEDLTAQNNQNTDGPAAVPTGWNLMLNGEECKTVADYSAAGASMNWCAINSGDNINYVDSEGNTWTAQYTDGDHLWGIWAANMPEVELYQEFTGIPVGTYILSCDMVCPWDWAGDGVTTQRIFANEYVQMFGSEENYADAQNITVDMLRAMAKDSINPDADIKHMNYAGHVNTESGGLSQTPRPMSLKFGVDESGVMRIGFRTNNVGFDGTVKPHDGSGWFKLDNFKLFYESTDLPTAIGSVEASDKLLEIVGQQYFTIDGRQVAQPQKGINIIKNIMSDGSVKTVKVLK